MGRRGKEVLADHRTTDDLGHHGRDEGEQRQENDTGDHQQYPTEIKPVPITPPESMTPVRDRDTDQLGVALRDNNQLLGSLSSRAGKRASYYKNYTPLFGGQGYRPSCRSATPSDFAAELAQQGPATRSGVAFALPEVGEARCPLDNGDGRGTFDMGGRSRPFGAQLKSPTREVPNGSRNPGDEAARDPCA